MPWSAVTLKTTSPVFNAGGHQQNDAGVRVPSLRGAMRFWFRALAGTVTGADLTQLAAVESLVFGSAETPSPLLLRISQQPAIRVKEQADFLPHPRVPRAQRSDHEGRWIVYLLGQALGNLSEVTLRRPYVPAGEAFEVKVKFSHPRGTSADVADAVEYLATASLWLTCTFGGIGARVRRGFGGVRIEAASDLPPAWIDGGHPLSPGLAFFERLAHLDATDLLPPAAKHLAKLTGEPVSIAAPGLGPRPAFPVLTHHWTTAGLTPRRTPEWGSWDKVLSHAGEQLRHFRASLANPGANYRPSIKTPEWVRTVHGAGTTFPLGALGLPVVYKDEFAVKVHDSDQVELRRASPLWLRPVCEGTSWRLFSFALRAGFLAGPGHPTVAVWKGTRSVRAVAISDGDVDALTDQWIKALAAGRSFADGSAIRC